MSELTIKQLHDRQNWGFDERGFSYKQNYISALEKAAASRLELLRDVRQLLDAIYAEDIVSSGDLGEVYEKLVEALGGGAERKTGFGPNDWSER